MASIETDRRGAQSPSSEPVDAGQRDSGQGGAALDGLDQYGRAQLLYGCLADAGLPAVLTPVNGSEAEIGWEDGHEVMARDLENWTTVVEGPAGALDRAVHEAFARGEVDPLTGAMAPGLWVDGVDHTSVWTQCLESSAYTNPEASMELDPGDLRAGSQRQADVANQWIACARDNGMPNLKDVMPDSGGGAPGPHAEIPLATDPTLLRSVVEQCPTFNEEVLRREIEGDPTLEDDLDAGVISRNPVVLVQAPPSADDEGRASDLDEQDRFFELGSILYEAEGEFVKRYGAEQRAKTTTPDSGSAG